MKFQTKTSSFSNMSYKRKSNESHFSERILRLKNNVMKTWRVMEEITGKNCKPEIFPKKSYQQEQNITNIKEV